VDDFLCQDGDLELDNYRLLTFWCVVPRDLATSTTTTWRQHFCASCAAYRPKNKVSAALVITWFSSSLIVKLLKSAPGSSVE